MILWLTPSQLQTIIQHAQQARPEEACGLILGQGFQAQQVIPTINIATTPQQRYRVDDRLLARHFDSLIGIYHSHPVGSPIPSRTDIEESCYPEYVYLIVGLKKNKPELAAWRFHDGLVDSVQLYVSTQPPNIETEALSKAQQIAIIVSALTAVALLIAISVSLLPPAPVIP